jgi:hypothetical protein
MARMTASCGTNDRNTDKGEVGGSSPPRPTIQIRVRMLHQKPQPTIQPTIYCTIELPTPRATKYSPCAVSVSSRSCCRRKVAIPFNKGRGKKSDNDRQSRSSVLKPPNSTVKICRTQVSPTIRTSLGCVSRGRVHNSF